MKKIIFFGLLFLSLAYSSAHITYASTPQAVIENGSSINRDVSSISSSLYKIANKNDSSQMLGVVVALLIGLAGIFSLPEIIKKNFYEKADAKVSIELDAPDCIKIPITDQLGQQLYETYYLRFKIESAKNQVQNVEVIALNLYKKGSNNRYVKVHQFLPMNLKWANFGELVMPSIPSGLYKHCDLGHIIQNPNPFARENSLLRSFNMLGSSNAVLILDTQVTPNTGSNYLLAGDYKLRIVVTGSNIKPKHFWFKIHLSNSWTGNERIMLQNNLTIKKTTAV
jgi:hypothetical protein